MTGIVGQRWFNRSVNGVQVHGILSKIPPFVTKIQINEQITAINKSYDSDNKSLSNKIDNINFTTP